MHENKGYFISANKRLSVNVVHNKSMFLISVACITLVGVLLLWRASAETSASQFEAESGSITAPARVASDSTASGGKFVRFGSTSAASTLPKQGISTGYKIFTRNATDRAFELDKIKQVFNGHPGYVRLDSTPTNQAQLDAVVADVLSRDLTPLLILYGTTSPRSVDNFGRDQAVKWTGKVHFFEIANEPDLNGWSPDAYADFVKGTAASVSAGNPNATVIAGALWKGGANYTTQDFVRSLAVRAKGSYQYISLHLYDDAKTRANWNIWDMAFPVLFGVNSYYKGNTCREILDTNGLSAVPIISTESGGTIDTYGEAGQNDIVAHGFDAVTSNLLPSMAVYSMKNDDVAGFGLLRDDGTERPAYATFQSRSKE